MLQFSYGNSLTYIDGSSPIPVLTFCEQYLCDRMRLELGLELCLKLDLGLHNWPELMLELCFAYYETE